MMVGSHGTDPERVTLSQQFENKAQFLLSATRFHSDGEDDLYMSKMIIENNMHGKISVENMKEGAKSMIFMPLAKDTKC